MQSRALTALACGVLLSGAVAGCGDSDHVIGSLVLADQQMDLTLEVTPEFDGNEAGTELFQSWLLVASRDGYIAGTGVRLRDGSLRPGTWGSVRARVVSDGDSVNLDPDVISFDWNESVDFSEIVVSLNDDGSITGHAAGRWEKDDALGLRRVNFSASVVARKDDQPPTATVNAGPVLTPLDNPAIHLSEPILALDLDGHHLRVTDQAGEAVPARIGGEWQDHRSGFAVQYDWGPVDDWKEGQSLHVELLDVTDWAGNTASSIDLGFLQMAEPLDSQANFDFEAGLDGWIAEYQGVTAQAVESYEIDNLDDDSGETLTILPPQGKKMLVIPAYGRVAGYLEAPQGIEICAKVGIIASRLGDMDEQTGVYYVEQSGGGGGLDLSRFGPFAYPKSGWSGFSEQCVYFNSDGWTTIAGNDTSPEWGQAGIAHILLLDDLYFR